MEAKRILGFWVWYRCRQEEGTKEKEGAGTCVEQETDSQFCTKVASRKIDLHIRKINTSSCSMFWVRHENVMESIKY
jgi:hypothetical protein